MTKPIRPDKVALEALSDQLRGDVLLPGDPQYTQRRRVWNDLHDHYPAVVARCRGAADVMAGVDFARDHDLQLAVKGGGHDYAGNSSCDDGLLIDLSPMDGVRVDPTNQTAQVGPGATWHDFLWEAQPFNLAIPGGPPQSGVSGVTLGGGWGALSCKYGLTLDHLIGADVVTAEGELVRASENENPDLFWALRGGGGNFGVVTSFEFQLQPVGPKVLAGQILHPYENAEETLRFYRKFSADAPDELTVFLLALRLPPLEFFPEEHHGKTALCFVTCYTGDLAEGEKVLAPLRNFGDPIADTIQGQPFLDFKHADDDAVAAIDRFYSKSHYLDELSDRAIKAVVENIEDLPGTVTLVGLMAMRGQLTAVASDATAFPYRSEGYEFDVWAAWSDPGSDEEVMDWARQFHRSMTPFADGRVYVNMLCHDEKERVETAYGDNYERLVQIKDKWDPDNLFRRNHNIEPSAADS